MPQRDTEADTRWERLPCRELLPAPPFVAIFDGPCGSGKSSAVFAWAREMKPYFDEYVIVSSSVDAEPAWRSLAGRKRPKVVFTDWNEAAVERYLDGLREDQLERMEEGEEPLRCCMILDDLAGYPVTRQGRPTCIERAALVHRHEHNLTIIYATQSIRSTTRLFRSQASLIAMFRCSEEEQKRVWSDYGGLLPRKGFIQMATAILQQPHAMLVIKRAASVPPLQSCFHGFARHPIDVRPWLPAAQRRALEDAEAAKNPS